MYTSPLDSPATGEMYLCHTTTHFEHLVYGLVDDALDLLHGWPYHNVWNLQHHVNLTISISSLTLIFTRHSEGKICHLGLCLGFLVAELLTVTTYNVT